MYSSMGLNQQVTECPIKSSKSENRFVILVSTKVKHKHVKSYFANIWCLSGIHLPLAFMLLSACLFSFQYCDLGLLPNLVCPSVVQLEMIIVWWERFGSESGAFFLWINQKQKELEAVNIFSSSDPLDKHISTVEVCQVYISITAFHSIPCFLFYVWVGFLIGFQSKARQRTAHCSNFSHNSLSIFHIFRSRYSSCFLVASIKASHTAAWPHACGLQDHCGFKIIKIMMK